MASKAVSGGRKAGGLGGKVPGKLSKQHLSSSKLIASTKQMTGSVARMSTVNAPGAGYGQHGGDDYGDQQRVVQKPENQVQLTDKELNEEITRVLKADNPHAPENVVRFDHKEGAYKPTNFVDQLSVHFELQSNLIHVESDEAVRQLEREDEDGADAAPASATASTTSASAATQSNAAIATQTAGDGEGGEGGGGPGEGGVAEAAAEDGDKASRPSTHKKKLMNQFNFSERASLTKEVYMRDRTTQTQPPPREVYACQVNQAEIFDYYTADLEKQQREKEAKEKKKGGGSGRDTEAGRRRGDQEDASTLGPDDCTPITNAARIMERMVNQNVFDELSQDFKYYEDPLDEAKKPAGSLMPLWRFTYDGARRKTITALTQNPRYSDLFVAGFGSYDFDQPADQGLVCFFSLKNPSFPEYTFKLTSGVTSLDVHPQLSHLVAVGLYDGCVAVIDCTKAPETQPGHFSTVRTPKHLEPVWQVRWQKEDAEGRFNFYSVSSDGNVSAWTLVQNELERLDVVKLQLIGMEIGNESSCLIEAPVVSDPLHPINLGCGMCFDFHPTNQNVFLVGTEEGIVHKCSKAYSSRYLNSFRAHNAAIYAVAWNPFQPRVFATCGADWIVQLWDDQKTAKALYKFHVRSPITDLAWAPYSATVFATTAHDGYVRVYDLSVNKYDPICTQLIPRKRNTQATKIIFSQAHPMVLVGDEKGAVTCLKLSPNLRLAPAQKTYSRENEIAKLDKLIAFVREPASHK